MTCFFGAPPFEGGYTIFAGLDDLLAILEDFRFDEEDLRYLASLEIFGRDFLSTLKALRFSGTIHAFREGSLVFPGEPLIRVEAR